MSYSKTVLCELMSYSIAEKNIIRMKYINKDYSNRQIHLGLVASCRKNNRFGLLYGFRKPPYDGKEELFENKLFYFEKDPLLEISENTLVSYLAYDYNGFTPKVDYVYPVSSLVKHKDERGVYRADDVYHDDETWRLINEGIPFLTMKKVESIAFIIQ